MLFVREKSGEVFLYVSPPPLTVLSLQDVIQNWLFGIAVWSPLRGLAQSSVPVTGVQDTWVAVRSSFCTSLRAPFSESRSSHSTHRPLQESDMNVEKL